MKFIGLLLSLILLVGCSTKDDYCFVKDDLTKIYSVPYIEVDKTNVDKMDAAIDTLSERFKDDFSEDTLMKHIAIQTFIYLNDVDENIIIDARLGFYLAPKAFRVYMIADENVAAERLFTLLR